MKIIAEASPYCFGSTSILLYLSRHLHKKHKISIICSEITKDQFISQKQYFEEIKVEKFKDENKYKKNKRLIVNSDLYLSVMNWIGLEDIEEENIKTAYIDSLFWKNRTQTFAMENFDYYFIESYPNVKEDISNFDFKIKNPHIVNPMFDMSNLEKKQSEKEIAVINLGGGESPLIDPNKNSKYGELILKILSKLDKKGFFKDIKEIYICSGKKRISEMKEKSYIFPKAKLRSLPQEKYFQLLSKCDLFMTSPGLNGPYEGFFLEKPTIFLPPQNLTQVFHLKDYVNLDLAPSGLKLSNYGPKIKVEKRFDEKEDIKKVLSKINLLVEKDDVIEGFANSIFNHFKNKEQSNLIKSQKRYLNDLFSFNSILNYFEKI